MKEVLLLFLLLHLIRCSSWDSIAGQRRYNLLLFYGSDDSDDRGRIRLSNPNMQPFKTAFSLCTWTNRQDRSDGRRNRIVHYYTEKRVEIVLTTDGSRTQLFGNIYDLSAYYSSPKYTWFHVCLVWGSNGQSSSISLYINGLTVYQNDTIPVGNLKQNGTLEIGGGVNDIYQLNMFSRELTGEEIREMAGNMCSTFEGLEDVRRIRWEDILREKRDGIVNEYASECGSKRTFSSLWDGLDEMSTYHKQTMQELNETKVQKLSEKELQLGQCKSELIKVNHHYDTVLGMLQQNCSQIKRELRIS